MIRRSQNRAFYILIILLLLAAVGVTFGNYALARNFSGGYEFLAHWKGAQVFSTEGESPYSDRTTGIIQALIAEQDGIEDSIENYRYSSPLYSIILFIPLGFVKDPLLARAIWMTISELLLLLVGWLSFRSISWRPGLVLMGLSALYSLTSYPSLIPFLSGSSIILSLAFLMLFLRAIVRGEDNAAGLMLAFAMIKPETAIVLLIYTLAWAIKQKRYAIIFWFLGTLALMVGFSFLLIPGWMADYSTVFLSRPPIGIPAGSEIDSSGAFSPLQNRLVIAKNAVLLLFLIFEWLLVKNADKKRFMWTAFLTLLVTPWFGISVDISSVILTTPALLFSLSLLGERWKQGSFYAILTILGAALIFPWLFSGYFLSFIPGSFSKLMLTIAFPLLVLIVLYWFRWWVSQPSTILKVNQKMFK